MVTSGTITPTSPLLTLVGLHVRTASSEHRHSVVWLTLESEIESHRCGRLAYAVQKETYHASRSFDPQAITCSSCCANYESSVAAVARYNGRGRPTSSLPISGDRSLKVPFYSRHKFCTNPNVIISRERHTEIVALWRF